MPADEIERLHAQAEDWLSRNGARVVMRRLPSGALTVKVTLMTGAATEFRCTSDEEYREELVLAVDALRT